MSTIAINELIFQQFAENIDEVIFVTTPQVDKIIYINPGYEKIWGKSCESLYQNPESWIDSIIEEDKTAVQEQLNQITSNIRNGTLQYRILRSDGTIRFIYVKLCCVKDKEGNFINLIGIASDITEYVQQQKENEVVKKISIILEKYLTFREAGPQLIELMRNIFDWELAELWMVDFSTKILRNIANSYGDNSHHQDFANNNNHYTFALDKGLPGKIWQAKAPLWISDFSKNSVYPRSNIGKQSELHQAIGFPIIFKKEVLGIIIFYSKQIHKPDPHFINMLMTVGYQIGIYICQKHNQEQLIELSRNDILTGLANRATIEEDLDNYLDENPNKLLAVVIIGIDRMRSINQAFGFDVGEIFLKSVARRLLAGKLESMFIFRASGTKFGFVLSQINDLTDINKFTTKLFDLFQKPFEIADYKLIETISIGVSLYPQDTIKSNTLLKNAEIANRCAQDEGGNRIRFFDKEISLSSSRKLILENDMRKALENNEFNLYYQPTVNLKTKKITGVEALLRWNHPDKGLLVASDFIHLAEETGLIIQLGDWVIQEACRTLHEIASSNANITMSINISIHQFSELDFIKKLQNVIDSCDILPDSLQLEITENFIINNNVQFSEIINILKGKLGVRVALDDFGTGYSSLSYLTYSQVDSIKIDKTFIDGIPETANNIAIIKAIIAIAKTLVIKSVAEGVETQEQWDFLSEAGCDEAQGYFFCHPMPKDQLIKYLQGDLESYILNKK